MFWDSNSDPPCANSIVLSTHPALSLIFFIFYRYLNHRYPLNFYRSFSILFSTYKSPKTLSILFEHRTLFKSSQTKFERRAYKHVHFVSQKKILFFFFLFFFFFFFFSRQVSKRWQVESFESIRKRGCCFSRRSSLYRNRPRATLFIFLHVLLPLLEAIRRPRSSKHPFSRHTHA